jgi:hypothetical protein
VDQETRQRDFLLDPGLALRIESAEHSRVLALGVSCPDVDTLILDIKDHPPVTVDRQIVGIDQLILMTEHIGTSAASEIPPSERVGQRASLEFLLRISIFIPAVAVPVSDELIQNLQSSIHCHGLIQTADKRVDVGEITHCLTIA